MSFFNCSLVLNMLRVLEQTNFDNFVDLQNLVEVCDTCIDVTCHTLTCFRTISPELRQR